MKRTSTPAPPWNPWHQHKDDGDWRLVVPTKILGTLTSGEFGLTNGEALLTLWLFANVRPGSDLVDVSLGRLTKSMGATLPTVRGGIRKLRDKGLRVVRPGDAVTQAPARYDVSGLRKALLESQEARGG